jgi:radical SAM superfamily enzyme YgiQ (UPF0313 family)
MNVLLIYPEVPDTFWSFKHALKFIRKRAGSPPVGLLTVAAMLPAPWNKRLVDLQITTLTDQDLEWADMAMISAMSVQRDAAQEVITRCHKAGIKTVVGGPLFTIEPDGFTDVDHFVLNEAELTLPLFLADLERGCAQKVYSTTEFASIQETPVPLWELADMRQYGWMSLQYSRGCPFKCDFCSITSLLGHRSRAKTSGQILAELDALWLAGWRGNTFFVDDNFIGNRGRLKADLLPVLIEWQRPAVPHGGFDQPGRRRGTGAADGPGGVSHGLYRHRDPERRWPGRVQQEAERGPRPRGRRQAPPARGPARPGRIHPGI